MSDILTLVSPAVIIVTALIGVVRWLAHRFEAKQNADRLNIEALNRKLNQALIERADAQDAQLALILQQTTATNGKLITNDREHTVFRERLAHVEGQTEVLLREKGLPL